MAKDLWFNPSSSVQMQTAMRLTPVWTNFTNQLEWTRTLASTANWIYWTKSWINFFLEDNVKFHISHIQPYSSPAHYVSDCPFDAQYPEFIQHEVQPAQDFPMRVNDPFSSTSETPTPTTSELLSVPTI